jgi:hypothetical protein
MPMIRFNALPAVYPIPLLVSLATGAAISLYAVAAHAADDDAIKTDRPDFVESSDVVGKGRVQVETAFSVERNHADGSKDRTSTTPTLLRIGAGESWEARLETDGRTVFRSRDDATGRETTARGYADVSVGVKWHMQDGEGTRPGVAWLLHADLDTGSSAFRGNGTRPSLRMVAEWDLPHDFSLGVMPGLTYDKTDEGKRFVAGIFGVVLGKEWTERFRTYIELAAPRIAKARNGGSNVTYDVGAAYLLSPNWQVDLSLQQAANKNTPDRTWAIGLSTRF